MIKRSNYLMLRRIRTNMGKLSKSGENALFISQHDNAQVDHASVAIFLVHDEDKNEDYLRLRRLFRALEYRFNHDVKDYEIKVSIKRKEKE